MKHETSQWNIDIVASNFKYWAEIFYRSSCHVDPRMRFSNCCLLSVMKFYPNHISLIKTFNFWLFLPVTDRLFCVLSLVHSYSRAQVARWLLPRLVWPLRRVYSRYTGYTAQSCPDTTPVNISHPHTAGTHTTTEQCGWRFLSFHYSLFPF